MTRRAPLHRSLAATLGYTAVLALFVPAMLVRFHLCCVVPAMCGGPDGAGEPDAVPMVGAGAGTPAPQPVKRSCCRPSPEASGPATPAPVPSTTDADAPPATQPHGDSCDCQLGVCRQSAAGFNTPNLATAPAPELAPAWGIDIPAWVPGLVAAPEPHIAPGLRRGMPSALAGNALGGGDFTVPLRS